MRSPYSQPINIGSAEMVTIQTLTEMIIAISDKRISIRHIDGPKGVDIRTSNNNLIKRELDWSPQYPLHKGVEKTYQWIASKIDDQTA
jgi:nucleoside-diphosphate-sugar epimerase